MEESLVQHRGACHCARVQFEVDAALDIDALECNCSICSKSGFLHLIVPRPRFRLLQGAADLATYTFNTGVARHLFCKTCGIKSFYIPRSNPEGYSVNVRCLDPATIRQVNVSPFDGKDWEAHGADLASRSLEQ
jgi:hypothetical protein